jgi:RNA polymerase sigma-70 factor (ECF subfamily)
MQTPHLPSPGPSLDATLAAAAAGDGAAWAALVEAYAPRLYSLLLRQCGDRDLAEELTQATFVRIVSHLNRYDEQGRFEPWLFRIGINLLRDEARRRKRQAKTLQDRAGQPDHGRVAAWDTVQDHIAQHRDTPDHLRSPLEHIERDEQVQLLREAIAALPPADQQVLHLRHTAGLSFAQIAQVLQEPLGTVLARGHRALQKLKKSLLQDENRPPAARNPQSA